MAIGPARVLVLPAECAVIGRRELEGTGIERGERLLLKTRNSTKRWDNLEFQRDYVALDASAAQFLVSAGVTMVGVDYLSVGVFEGDGPETHKLLLGAGVWIVEGLDLSRVGEGRYDLVCLPLPIAGSDGSPARVVIRACLTLAAVAIRGKIKGFDSGLNKAKELLWHLRQRFGALVASRSWI